MDHINPPGGLECLQGVRDAIATQRKV